MGLIKGYDVKLRQGEKLDGTTLENYINISHPKHTYVTCVRVVKSPTGNCQLSSIAQLDCILEFTQTDDDSILDIIKEVHKVCKCGKPLVMVDVKQHYTERLKKCFGNKIIHEHPYQSTNNSAMCLFLINLRD